MPVSYQGDTPPGLKSRGFSAGGNAARASQIRRVRAATLALPHERVTLVGAPAVVLAGQAIMRRGGAIHPVCQGYSSGSDDLQGVGPRGTAVHAPPRADHGQE